MNGFSPVKLVLIHCEGLPKTGVVAHLLRNMKAGQQASILSDILYMIIQLCLDYIDPDE